MIVTAQFALYPLGVDDIGPALRVALEAVRATGLDLEVGRMASFIEGEEDVVFAALRDAFRAVAERDDVILTVTVSNAC